VIYWLIDFDLINGVDDDLGYVFGEWMIFVKLFGDLMWFGL